MGDSLPSWVILGDSLNSPSMSQRRTPSSGSASISSVVIGVATVAMSGLLDLRYLSEFYHSRSPDASPLPHALLVQVPRLPPAHLAPRQQLGGDAFDGEPDVVAVQQVL